MSTQNNEKGMDVILELLLWVSVGLVLYTYVLYPGIVFLLSKLLPRPEVKVDINYLPTVSVVISAYNEESILPQKLRNIATTDYPQEKIEFLIGSDGSNDQTDSILAAIRTANVKFERFPARSGKANVLNKLIPKASGEIIVFSDANTMYDPAVVRKLVGHFCDPSIGGVCGELRLKVNQKAVGEIGEAFYWRYESFLKNVESKYRTLLGATGGVYAIRKSLFKPLPTSKAIMDDFLTPIEVVRCGYRVLYEPDAIATEEATDTVCGEFQRKVRIGAANFNGISEFADLLDPGRGFVAFALWSHKIIRWTAPFFLFLIFSLSFRLAFSAEFYRWFCYIQISFLLTGTVGFIFERKKIGLGILAFPYYFIAMNLALFIGLFKSLFGRQRSTWTVIR